jgi:hypothetical protein
MNKIILRTIIIICILLAIASLIAKTLLNQRRNELRERADHLAKVIEEVSIEVEGEQGEWEKYVESKSLARTDEKIEFSEHPEAIDTHISKFYKDEELKVFHEILRSGFPIDIYLINSKKHQFNILLTSGLSTYKMDIDDPELQFAELMILIPKSIQFGEAYTGESENDWIISILKQTAKVTYGNKTFLSIGHTFQANVDLGSYSSETDYIGCIVLPSVSFQENFTEVKTQNSKINIYSLFPLYKSELQYKIKNKYQAFLDLLNKNNAKEVLNLSRHNLLNESKSQ